MIDDMDSQCGIIYSATGEFWRDEAINSAKASRRFNHIPHIIFSDLAAPQQTPEGRYLTIAVAAFSGAARLPGEKDPEGPRLPDARPAASH